MEALMGQTATKLTYPNLFIWRRFTGAPEDGRLVS
jgi:hypothetical protein